MEQHLFRIEYLRIKMKIKLKNKKSRINNERLTSRGKNQLNTYESLFNYGNKEEEEFLYING
jgi:hypothetical protein